MALDIIVSRTHGVVSMKDCRVIWTEGRIYVCKSPTDIASFECEEPKKHGGIWRTQVGEAALTMQPPGCGTCRKRVQASPIGQMSVQAIVDSVALVNE